MQSNSISKCGTQDDAEMCYC